MYYYSGQVVERKVETILTIDTRTGNNESNSFIDSHDSESGEEDEEGRKVDTLAFCLRTKYVCLLIMIFIGLIRI